MADSPYPELKKSHVPQRVGRPYSDHKPPPSAPVWAVIGGFGAYHALTAALELGVFDALSGQEWTPAATLADDVAASPPHLVALLDALVVLGLLERLDDTYRLNDTATRYLTTTGAASMAALVPLAPGPLGNWATLAATVRSGCPAAPVEDDPAAFYRPLVEGTFTTMLRAATRADLHVRYSALSAVRVLDLGAGGAPWSIAVLRACPDATAVVNDLAGVIEVARRTTAEHEVADRCEFRPGDYHDVPIESERYDLVVLGHVCRTEGPEGAQHLIGRAFDALQPQGRLLLADYFVAAEPQQSPQSTLMGLTMVASTRSGFPITHEQTARWLTETGFEHLRLIEPIGGQLAYVATKPRRSGNAAAPAPRAIT